MKKTINYLFFVGALSLHINLFELRAEPLDESVFSAESMYVEIGGSGNALPQNKIQLENGLLYYNALNGYLNNSVNQGDLMLYTLLERQKTRSRMRMTNEGYVRSEMSLGSWFSFGAILSQDRFIINQIPSDLYYNSADINSIIGIVVTNVRDTVSLPNQEFYDQFLYSNLVFFTTRLDFTSFTPEIGFHLSNDLVDVYLRAGSSLSIGSSKNAKAKFSSGNLGLRWLLFDPVSMHFELYGRRWYINSTNGPSFDVKFNEYGARFGIGLRLQHP